MDITIRLYWFCRYGRFHSFIHSFRHPGYFYSASSSPLLLRGTPDSTDTVLEFHAEAPQAIASEGLAQGPYMVARAGFEPTTLRTKGNESTNELPCPWLMINSSFLWNVYSTMRWIQTLAGRKNSKIQFSFALLYFTCVHMRACK